MVTALREVATRVFVAIGEKAVAVVAIRARANESFMVVCYVLDMIVCSVRELVYCIDATAMLFYSDGR